MNTAKHNIPIDLLPIPDVPEDHFDTQFNPQQQLRNKKSFVNKVFNKRSGGKNLRDNSDNESIRSNASGSGSIRQMFTRKNRSNTVTSTASASSFDSTYSQASMMSNASTASSYKPDKYGMNKTAWVPMGF